MMSANSAQPPLEDVALSGAPDFRNTKHARSHIPCIHNRRATWREHWRQLVRERVENELATWGRSPIVRSSHP